VPATPANPIASMGDSRFACVLQGGGVYVSSGIVTITSSSIYGNGADYVRAHVQKFTSPPHVGDSHFARCLQGGGVYVRSGTVSIVKSKVYSNTVYAVRAHVLKFASPQWENC